MRAARVSLLALQAKIDSLTETAGSSSITELKRRGRELTATTKRLCAEADGAGAVLLRKGKLFFGPTCTGGLRLLPIATIPPTGRVPSGPNPSQADPPVTAEPDAAPQDPSAPGNMRLMTFEQAQVECKEGEKFAYVGRIRAIKATPKECESSICRGGSLKMLLTPAAKMGKL